MMSEKLTVMVGNGFMLTVERSGNEWFDPQRLTDAITAFSRVIDPDPASRRDYVVELNQQRTRIARMLRDDGCSSLDFGTRERLADISENIGRILIDMDRERK